VLAGRRLAPRRAAVTSGARSGLREAESMGLGFGRVWISASGQQAEQGACPWNAGPGGRRHRGRGATASAPPAALVTGRSHDALGLATARHSGQAQNWAVARYCGEIDQAFQAACKLVLKFASQHPSLTLSNETGSTGSDRYRGSGNRGYECLVLAPSVIPSKATPISPALDPSWSQDPCGIRACREAGRAREPLGSLQPDGYGR
jgi:hypothetical protein